MLPNTVGELRALIADMPDDLPFRLDVNGPVGEISNPRYELDHKFVMGWNGTKPITGKALVFLVDADG